MNDHFQSFGTISNSFVTVTVREPERAFTSHLDVICGVSSFFNKNLKGRDMETDPNTITLEDVRPAVWVTFLDWAYGRQTMEELYSTDRQIGEYRVHLTELYVFADKYDVPALRRQIIDVLFRDLKGYHDNEAQTFWRPLPSHTCISLAFGSLPSTSPLCRLLVDRFCINFVDQITENDQSQMFEREALPPQFYMAALRRHAILRHEMLEGVTEVDYELSLSDYHEHGMDEDTSKCSCTDSLDDEYYDGSYYEESYHDGN